MNRLIGSVHHCKNTCRAETCTRQAQRRSTFAKYQTAVVCTFVANFLLVLRPVVSQLKAGEHTRGEGGGSILENAAVHIPTPICKLNEYW